MSKRSRNNNNSLWNLKKIPKNEERKLKLVFWFIIAVTFTSGTLRNKRLKIGGVSPNLDFSLIDDHYFFDKCLFHKSANKLSGVEGRCPKH